MSILKGYAEPISFPQGSEHTYVESDTPYFYWECHGKSHKGREICWGYGDANIANCLSQGGQEGNAGITYGVNGVCHQIANRILYPAGVTVSSAGGYGASVILYGTYGVIELITLIKWNKLKKKCGAKRAVSPALEIESKPKNTPENIYFQKIVDLYSEHDSISRNSDDNVIMKEINGLMKKEINYLIEYRLGGKVDSHIAKPIQKQQVGLLKERSRKIEELYNGDISTEKYVKEMNNLVGDTLISLQENLGKNIYEEIFNLPANKESFILIDPDIAKNYLKINLNHK